MTRDEIISMARQAGVFESIPLPQLVPLERFAQLVIANFLARTGQYVTNDASREAAIAEAVAAEREACAKVCDERCQMELAKAKSAREIRNIAAAHDYELNADQAMLMAQDIRARSQP